MYNLRHNNQQNQRPKPMTNIINFTYTDSKNNTSDRSAVVVSPAKPLMTTLDVTALDQETVANLQADLKEYQEYRKRHLNAMFSLEDWLSHTNARTPSSVLNYRSFNPSSMIITK